MGQISAAGSILHRPRATPWLERSAALNAAERVRDASPGLSAQKCASGTLGSAPGTERQKARAHARIEMSHAGPASIHNENSESHPSLDCLALSRTFPGGRGFRLSAFLLMKRNRSLAAFNSHEDKKERNRKQLQMRIPCAFRGSSCGARVHREHKSAALRGGTCDRVIMSARRRPTFDIAQTVIYTTLGDESCLSPTPAFQISPGCPGFVRRGRGNLGYRAPCPLPIIS